MTTIAQSIKNITTNIHQASGLAQHSPHLVEHTENFMEDLMTYIFDDNSKLFIQNNTIEVE